MAMSSLGSAPLEPHPRRVARYRLDACTGVGALLIGSKPFSTLKAWPPELKHSLLARSKGASVLRDCAPTLAVAAPAVVVVSNSRLSGTDAKPLKNVTFSEELSDPGVHHT